MKNEPQGRRCRVALLPDCHVQRDRRLAVPDRPTKRLYGVAAWLLETYLGRLSALDVDAAFLLGDTLDPADEAGVNWLNALIEQSDIPVYVVVGNHEPYGWMSMEQFHAACGLPEHGNYVVYVKGVPFLMLATPDQDSLTPGGLGDRWLRERLAEYAGADLFCCAHFSLILHPCVQGWNNDGMQVLWSAKEVLALLREHPNVRAWFAGHKNVPSKVVRDGLLHLLSPQLIQVPCGFRVIDIHENGIASEIHLIEEQEIAELSRRAHGAGYVERLGNEDDRDFWWSWN